MAVLREEYVGYDQRQGAVKDYLVEAESDLETLAAGVGSLAYVLAIDAVRCKTASGTWAAVGGNAE